MAAALEGIITSKLMHEATTRDAFPHMKDSVFLQSGGGGGGGESRGGVGRREGRDHAAADDDDDEGDDAVSRFWETLRGCDALLEELPELLNECKAAIRKRSALPMLVESELRYAPGTRGVTSSPAPPPPADPTRRPHSASPHPPHPPTTHSQIRAADRGTQGRGGAEKSVQVGGQRAACG